MGVLSCVRARCENIMCSRYSSKYGYICYECFEELVALGVKTDIEQFLSTPKVCNVFEATHAFFDKIFPLDD